MMQVSSTLMHGPHYTTIDKERKLKNTIYYIAKTFLNRLSISNHAVWSSTPVSGRTILLLTYAESLE
jgi:hypothetical protein